MNNGQICVSVSAKTADGLLGAIAGIPTGADLIEIRFDRLESHASNPGAEAGRLARRVLKEFPKIRFIFTFRPLREGGFGRISAPARTAFWNSGFEVEIVDREIDIATEEFGSKHKRLLVSFHDFDGSASKVNDFAKAATEIEADIIKIASVSSDVVDGLELWKLFEKFAAPGRNGDSASRLIPISMGDAGKWTRILGPAFGAPFTYASPDTDAATAPGQIPFREMEEVYRVRTLKRDTEVYGVVGGLTAHSLSPYMHNAAFKEHSRNAVYIPFEVKDLAAFIRRMVKPDSREIAWNMRGFSVTIPFKEKIIRYLDFLDPAAESIGAVNTVQIVDGQLVGLNTDSDGFIEPLSREFGELGGARVAVIGAGGAARACVYGLREAGAAVTVFARNPSRAEALARDFNTNTADLNELAESIGDFEIAVNATPLGMLGDHKHINPVHGGSFESLQLAYDLVYNPIDTLFLREAEKAGVKTVSGIRMLIAQGTKQYELWTGLKAPIEIMEQALRTKLG